ncbi:MAG: hypothetical protein K2M75_07955 [Clostridia bacterium]|nr:hypothetical protein [Clostridia bacterium]
MNKVTTQKSKGENKKEKYKYSNKKVYLISLAGLLIIAAVFGVAFGSYALGVNFAKTAITINENETYQTMQGFGASSAWVYQALGIYDNEDLKDETIEMLYGDGGLGLNTFRYNIGAGGAELNLYSDKLRGAESFFIADRFKGDYSVFSDVNNYDFTKDKGVMTLFEKALETGNIKEVVFFANSPHYLMTKNGKTHSNEKKQNNLKPECYKAYCEYILVIVDYLYTNVICKYDADIEVRISPVNEPQWDWGGEGASQEGCHFDPKYLAKFYDVFHSALVEFNESKSLNFAMDIFESGNYKMEDSKAKVKSYITQFAKYDWFKDLDGISVHSYGTDISKLSRVRFRGYMKNHHDGLGVRVSEYCVMKGGVDDSIDMGIYSAKVIMRDLSLIWAESWNYWLSVSTYDYEDGLVYWDGADNLSVTKRYYTMGQFSRYIPRGSVRIKADYNDEFSFNGVECVGYRRPDGSLVLVIINDSKRDKDIKLKFSGEKYENVKEIVTSGNKNWVTAEYKYDGYITVPAKSVATYILTRPVVEEA